MQVELFDHGGFQVGIGAQVGEQLESRCRGGPFNQVGDLSGLEPGQSGAGPSGHWFAVFGASQPFQRGPCAVGAAGAERPGQVMPPAAPLNRDADDHPPAVLAGHGDVAGASQPGQPQVEQPASEHSGDQ